MPDAADSLDLVERFRRGDADAARLLFEQYARRLVALAERHLSERFAGRLDGEDVVQSAFRSFFQRTADGRLRIDGSSQLWQLLVRITLTKVNERVRYHDAGKRKAAAESPEGEAWLAAALTREPGPAELATLADEVEALLAGLPSLYAQILGRRLENQLPTEIAQELAVSRQIVYRALEVLRRRMKKRA